MVKVVRARDAEQLAMARQVSSSEKVAEDLERARQRELRLAQIRSTTFSVPGQVLLDLRAAIAQCHAALRLQPDHFWAQFVLATCYLRSQR